MLIITNHACIQYYKRVCHKYFRSRIPTSFRKNAVKNIKTASLISLLEQLDYLDGKYPFMKGHRAIVKDNHVITIV